ncbi:MAG: hypothetical protein WAU11_03000 [Ignavibacteriaceae bacterium]|jgi:hypothetical protein
MEKSSLFFTYLSKLGLQKNNEIDEENNNLSNEKLNELVKIDNEWLQEYELIYSSYSIEGY